MCTSDTVRAVKSLLPSIVAQSATQAQILGPNGPVIQSLSNRQTGLKASSLAVILLTDKEPQGFFLLQNLVKAFCVRFELWKR